MEPEREKNLPGYAIGGLSGGEEKSVFWRMSVIAFFLSSTIGRTDEGGEKGVVSRNVRRGYRRTNLGIRWESDTVKVGSSIHRRGNHLVLLISY